MTHIDTGFRADLDRRVRNGLVVMIQLLLASSAFGGEKRMALQYLNGITKHVEAVKSDLPRLTRLGEEAAEKLLAGGELYAPAVAPWWTSELSGRAGGPMRVRRDASLAGDTDVALFALPHPALATLEIAASLQGALKGKADLYVLGPASMMTDYQGVDGKLLGGTRRLACLGGPAIGAGLYARKKLPPLAPYRPVIEMVRGWTFVGELVAACTRRGKMPTIWQSIVIPGSRARNASLKIESGPQKGRFPFFHPDRRVPGLAPGAVGRQYLDTILKWLDVLRGQTKQFARGGQWMAEARRAGHRVLAMAQGHAPALIVGHKNETKLPIDMYAGDYVRAVVPHARAGDAVVALCYMVIPAEKVLDTLTKGCKIIIACPHGLPKELKGGPNLLWLDLGWKVGDAVVDVLGYDVKMLPASAVMQMSALYALVAEMAARDASFAR